MNAVEYSDLKPAWHTRDVEMLRMGKRIVPPHVQLILSDLCNHDCPWCAYRMTGYPSNQHFGEAGSNNPKRFIPTSKAFEILEDCATLGVQSVEFTGGGEPTVHPDHLEIFDRANAHGLKLALVTNGCLLRDRWEQILKRFSWIRVSLDAGTPETYAAVRRTTPVNFGRALANIARLSALGGPKIGVSFIVMKENAHECGEAARLAKLAGAESIRFAAFFSTDRNYYADWDPEAEIPTSTDDFRIINMVEQRRRDLVSRPDYDRCGYQHFNVYIGGDQNIYRCCDTAYNDRGNLGSIKNRRFKDWWSDPATAKLYREFDAKGCDLCAFNGKNRVLSYLTAPQPRDVEFA